MKMIKDYEMVIGLEVHCELGTKSKIFCGCSTAFGAEPNTQCCPICFGLPGTLPVLNKKVVEYAVRAGMATNCEIATFSKMDRKNYFYPDLPKAYQISQYDLPICKGGWLEIMSEGQPKKIGITRIHIEEDAGKLVHDPGKGTMLDCNRSSMPLIEIVSEPDMRSAEEAVAYFKKLRSIILYTGVSDCKMQEGSLRCDVNLSVRKKGETKLGTRVEMKNLNSFAFIQKAIEYEYKRQIDELEAGNSLVQETRRYDQNTGKTLSMRHKENANDYRYFPDPNLVPITLTEEQLHAIRESLPILPDVRKKLYEEKYGLTTVDAEIITGELAVADYFEQAAALTDYPKLLANLMIAEMLKLIDSDDVVISISHKHIAQIAQMLGENKINSSVGKRVLKALWQQDGDAVAYVEANNLYQINDPAVIGTFIEEALSTASKAVQDYKNGKAAALQSLVGIVMSKTGGKANPVLTEDLLKEKLGS